jgi:hypothetical protein
MTLPQYGWFANDSNINAYTAMCGVSICDYAQTASRVFANSRNASDMLNEFGYGHPSISVTQANGTNVNVDITWNVFRSVPTDNVYIPFIHVADSNGKEVLGWDYRPKLPLSQWIPGETVVDHNHYMIPQTLPNGQYPVTIGLYGTQSGGVRLPLSGPPFTEGVNHFEYPLGVLNINGNGSEVTLTPTPMPQTDNRLNQLRSVVDFGTLRTDGMVSITKENGNWVARPFPRYRNFTLMVSASVFGDPPTVLNCDGGSSPTVVPTVADQGFWQIPMNGAKSYSWPATE